ncbi:MAG: D-alanyl-D-alanine carboxypeptidase/D-alanyl-D-alanine-endopeptidase [Chloroflexi bacterium]|nr:D-alanyl-D-alanine carboxypeptidase/D-alanyl-D-alanine-endopeptidase [Chloroflexota bacterium]MBV9601144.1 D-alanyl-D-alanine carboxypeptidase/D-alanyl-D-alanine-endopeptidase [Chloroflexota bacterium]
MRRSVACAALVVVVLVLVGTSVTQAAPSSLPSSITSVMNQPRYGQTRWSLLVADARTGETLYELEPDRLAFTGSVRKLFSVGLALKELGAEHHFETRVYQQGEVDPNGALQGNLVLVGGGDLTLGGRRLPDGGIAITDFDHNDANSLGTATLTPQDPLAGLDELANQVAASGITSIDGDVVIDDRLFDSYRVPNQYLLVTPTMVNENMVDVSVTPTQPGQRASVDYRPQTGAFRVHAAVETVAAGARASVSVPAVVPVPGYEPVVGLVNCVGTLPCRGTITGEIPADYQAPLSGASSFVGTFRMEDPESFARTAFIEALQRAGVDVLATSVARNPSELLPPPDAYTDDARVARLLSEPYADDARLILKVSLNLGANLSLTHFGLAHGERTLPGALSAERRALVELGVRPEDFDFPTNGSGSPDSQAAPRAAIQLLRSMATTPVADVFREALPVLGVDGSLAQTGVDLPARGHVFAKTGTTITDGELKAQVLAGYVEARGGRELAFAVYVNDYGPIASIDDVTAVFEDEARIADAIYQAN